MFRLPDAVIKGISDYKNSLSEFINGRMNAARFSGIRVPWGIYSHRGQKVFMSRIRIPAGIVTPEQLKAIAYAARTFGNGIAHITTRQDIQIHGVKIERTAEVIEYLKNFNLSPRGGGGNTLRNITACALSGICKEEVIDVRNYALSLTEYLLAQDSSYNLPRKFKVAFSGCNKDCSGCLVNDVGVLAQEKQGSQGFKIFVAGGMGAHPRTGRLLEEFIPPEELAYCISAVRNVFYKNGDRRNKHHNRLRFLLEDIGFDKFAQLYREELKSLKEGEYAVLRKIDFTYPQAAGEEIPQVKDDPEFQEFLKYSLYPQKQKGLVSVELRIPRGDLSSDELEALADLEKEFLGAEFRTSQNQNIFICSIKKGELYRLFLKIKEILHDFLYPSTLLDVVCCKGALTCNLGLCNSPALAEEVERTIGEHFVGTAAFKKLNLKINGCPNACGQHPLGLIGLHGVVRKVSARPLPFYRLLLGGRKDLENTHLAKDTGILIPAKNVPLFLRDFIGAINKEIEDKTDIYKYVDEKAEAIAREVVSKYSHVPAYSQDKSFYIDWGKSEEFSLEGLGPGECGIGVLDMIEADLADAGIALDNKNIKQALFFASRALLVTKGSDPKDEEGAILGFIEKFVKAGIAPLKFSDLNKVYAGLQKEVSPEESKEAFSYAQEFLQVVSGLYKNMDPAFNFPKQEAAAQAKGQDAKRQVLDLKGTPCPINYVKAKLFLEDLKAGDIIDILLDEGEPINNVPKSLENDGHKILGIEKQDGFYKLTVKKNN